MPNVRFSSLLSALKTRLDEIYRIDDEDHPLMLPLLPDVLAFSPLEGEYLIKVVGKEGFLTLDDLSSLIDEENPKELKKFEGAIKENEPFTYHKPPLIETEVEDGVLVKFCSVEGMFIDDPFLSECGRFFENPNRYGLPYALAEEIVTHNREEGRELTSDIIKEMMSQEEDAPQPKMGG